MEQMTPAANKTNLTLYAMAALLLVVAASIYVRVRPAETAAYTEMELLITSSGQQCATGEEGEKTTPDKNTNNDEIYFVGCGGFF